VSVADLTDYQRGFFDGIKLAREAIRRFREEHPLLCPITNAIGERIGDAELEAMMRFFGRVGEEADGG
jgi:hypothetical protein